MQISSPYVVDRDTPTIMGLTTHKALDIVMNVVEIITDYQCFLSVMSTKF